jgi:signal transduction histidine kinase
MERALANLIMNSIKYAGDGAKFRLSVQYTPNENTEQNLQIVVEDDGAGIPKELTKDIFQPFVRVDDSRNSKSGGTGLGLAITKAIIEKHGGIINLISDINAGSKFIIQFKTK